MQTPSAPPPRPPFPAAAFWSGLGAFILLALLFNVFGWDRAAAMHYYDQTPPWPGERWAWSLALYRHGQAPAVLCGVAGWVAFALSFADPAKRRWRGPGLYFGLLLLLGPGLLVNGLAKALTGRPRPFESAGFGGLWAFAAPFHFGIPGRGLSFLSGHAANAWYFLGLGFALPRGRRWLGFAVAAAFGAAMSLARVAQGAHWLSDTVLCGAALFTLAAGLSPLLHWQPRAGFLRRDGVLWALGLGALAWLSLSHVRYEERVYTVLRAGDGVTAPQQRLLTWDRLGDPADAAVDLSLDAGDLRVDFNRRDLSHGMPLGLIHHFRGQGLPGASERMDVAPLPEGAGAVTVGPETLAWGFHQSVRGLWLSAGGSSELALPAMLGVDARLIVNHGTLTMGTLPPGRRILLARLPQGVQPPAGFEPFGAASWLRQGDEPLISLDIKAPRVVFEP